MIVAFLKTIQKNKENHEICLKLFSLRYFNGEFLTFVISARVDCPFNSRHKILNVSATYMC